MGMTAWIDWDELLPPKSSEPTEKTATGGVTEQDQSAIDADIAAREAAGDDRRRCTECGNLTEVGICLAAQRGDIVASRGYSPIRELLRRCEGFSPRPTDPDQTPGSVKWGWLRSNAPLL